MLRSSDVVLEGCNLSIFLLMFLFIFPLVSSIFLSLCPSSLPFASYLALVPFSHPWRIDCTWFNFYSPCPSSEAFASDFQLAFSCLKLDLNCLRIVLPALDLLWICSLPFKLDHITTIFSQHHSKCLRTDRLYSCIFHIMYHDPFEDFQVNVVSCDNF